MSATYRQRSDVTDELLEKDPRNLLLARYTRVRMPAETGARQCARGQRAAGAAGRRPERLSVSAATDLGRLRGLYLSGCGPVPADAHHRRSMYSFIKRNAPHPAMAAFDMPDRGTTSVRRQIVEHSAAGAGAARRPAVSWRRIVRWRRGAEERDDARRAVDDGVPAGDAAPAATPGAARSCASYYDAQVQRYARTGRRRRS